MAPICDPSLLRLHSAPVGSVLTVTDCEVPSTMVEQPVTSDITPSKTDTTSIFLNFINFPLLLLFSNYFVLHFMLRNAYTDPFSFFQPNDKT